MIAHIYLQLVYGVGDACFINQYLFIEKLNLATLSTGKLSLKFGHIVEGLYKVVPVTFDLQNRMMWQSRETIAKMILKTKI